MSNSLFDRYTPQVAKEIQELHMFLQELSIYLVVANQGYSVKVLDKARKRNLSLEAAVSLYNKGNDSYAARSLTEWQKKALALQSMRFYTPLTLQRCMGILATEKCLTTSDAVIAVKLVNRRRKELAS